MTALCLTCSAPLTNSIPSSSEKPLPPILELSCGKHAICGGCQARSARYARQGQRCLLCTDALALLSTSNEAELDEGANEFVLGDEDDDDDIKPPPPPYKPLNDMTERVTSDKEGLASKEDEERCSIHHLKPEETLAGLALKYKIAGSELCRLNRLPLSTLNTTPQLVHTRPFLVLPPGAKSESTEPIRSEEEERRRLMLRRFQMETKAPYEVAKAYLDTVYADRQKEVELINANRSARGDSPVVEERRGGELEEAVSRWKADERWEQEQGNSKFARRAVPGRT